MFTVKIQREGGVAVRLFSMKSVRAMEMPADEFIDLRSQVIKDEPDTGLHKFMTEFHGYVCDMDGDNEYWLSENENCFITDGSGKTVHSIVYTEPEHVFSSADFKEQTGHDYEKLFGEKYPGE